MHSHQIGRTAISQREFVQPFQRRSIASDAPSGTVEMDHPVWFFTGRLIFIAIAAP
jgi:hypothetical protein